MTRLALLVLLAVAAPLSSLPAPAPLPSVEEAASEDAQICITISGQEYCIGE